MSAERLREAAALMRSRAQAASDVTGSGDWHSGLDWMNDPSGGWSCFSVMSAGYVVVTNGAEEEAGHVASWHPTVALAVADWLDKIAWTWELDPDLKGRVGGDEALAVANAYLGATA